MEFLKIKLQSSSNSLTAVLKEGGSLAITTDQTNCILGSSLSSDVALKKVVLIIGQTQKLIYMWSDNEVRELITVKVLHTPLLNITLVAFKVFPLGSYAPILAPSPPFKTILELVLWNGLRITLDFTDVIKMPSFQYFRYLWEQKKGIGARSAQ
jgi:hypothetical protein